jgi:hypothetical protein
MSGSQEEHGRIYYTRQRKQSKKAAHLDAQPVLRDHTVVLADDVAPKRFSASLHIEWNPFRCRELMELSSEAVDFD